MGWSAGVFSRLYNFVADAAAGTKILASKQDAEWANVATGLNNCITKDGTNVPTANMNWGGYKLSNLANGVAATDAATVGQIGSTSDWVAETAGVTWLSATTFKVLAADKRTTYAAGRRVRSLNTAVLVYSTVVSSSYSAPDTTVTVVNDGSSALDASMSALNYGLISYTSQSYLPQRSAVSAYKDASLVLAASTLTLLDFNQEVFDRLGEYDTTTYTFTAKQPSLSGSYMVSGQVRFTNPAALSSYAEVLVVKNTGTAAPVGWTIALQAPGETSGLPFSALVDLAVGDYVRVYVRATEAGTTAGAPSAATATAFLHISRVP